MRIGELARRTEATVKAVRYYESLGLLGGERLANGYRDFGERDVVLVREIRDLAALGVRAEKTRPFLDCLVAGHENGDDCPGSVAVYRAAIDELGGRIDDLARRRNALVRLLGEAGGRAEPSCDLQPRSMTGIR